MNKVKLIGKGFIIGLGKIIPGVSGGMLAMAMGVYTDAIEAISHFFRSWKRNFLFLFLLAIGALFSIATMSNVIEYSLHHYYLPTMLLFIGLMLGGFSSLSKEIKDTDKKKYGLYFLIPFILLMVLGFSRKEHLFLYDGSIKSVVSLFFFGVIDAITMIVPGISGTAILMLLGCYNMIIETLGNALNLSMMSTTLPILCPFLIGMGFGVIMIIKIVSFLLEKKSIPFYYVIVSCFISSIVLLFLQTLKQNYSLKMILISFLCLFAGYLISKRMENHYNESSL